VSDRHASLRDEEPVWSGPAAAAKEKLLHGEKVSQLLRQVEDLIS